MSYTIQLKLRDMLTFSAMDIPFFRIDRSGQNTSFALSFQKPSFAPASVSNTDGSRTVVYNTPKVHRCGVVAYNVGPSRPTKDNRCVCWPVMVAVDGNVVRR